jgi:ArsR family metal-binding transcriptional regulator
MKFRLIRVCKGEAMSAIPQEPVRYDLKTSAATLVQNGYRVDDKDIMIIAERSGVEITLYINGRLMMTPMQDKELAKSTAGSFYSMLTLEKE